MLSEHQREKRKKTDEQLTKSENTHRGNCGNATKSIVNLGFTTLPYILEPEFTRRGEQPDKSIEQINNDHHRKYSIELKKILFVNLPNDSYDINGINNKEKRKKINRTERTPLKLSNKSFISACA